MLGGGVDMENDAALIAATNDSWTKGVSGDLEPLIRTAILRALDESDISFALLKSVRLRVY